LRLEPLRYLAGGFSKRRLLQCLGRDLLALRMLQPRAQRVERLALLAFAVPRRQHLAEQFLQLQRGLLARLARQIRTLRQCVQGLRRLQLRGLGAFFLLALLLLQQPPLLTFQLLDACALHLSLALAARCGLRVGVPRLLPRHQRVLAALQRVRSAVFRRVSGVEAGHHGFELLRQRFELAAVTMYHRLELGGLRVDLFQIGALSLPQFARVLDALFYPCNLGAGLVVAGLYRAEVVGLGRLIGANAFDLRLGAAQFGEHTLHCGFATRGRGVAHACLAIQALQAQYQHLGEQLALLLLEGLIAPCAGRLALQVANLLFDFFPQIVEPIQILARMPDAALGFPSPLL